MLGAADILIGTGFWAGICGAGRVCVAWGGILTPVTASGRAAGENGAAGPCPAAHEGQGLEGPRTRAKARAPNAAING